ncbi:MAG TPA: GFA family protein [Candidatus Limnocylindrales bacterium]|nr:GFA family protein [Candidatus Limnocylindrales bacterium]
MAEITGGCLCGNVRYQASGEPIFQGVCHCTDCQRSAGTAFNVTIAFREDDVRLTGELKLYQSKSEAGGDVSRWFCPTCGSGIYSQPATAPGMMFVKAGTLDDTSILAPRVHIFTDSRQSWLTLPDDALTFPRSPT